MNPFVRRILILPLTLTCLGAAGTSIAGGQPCDAEDPPHDIRALAPADIEALLAGKGMGLARAAELNGYPGPLHVLELADELALTPAQRANTSAIFAEMLASARRLGAELVAAECALDTHFRERTIDRDTLGELTVRIGRLQARLRATHLEAHLRQTALLSREQIALYRVLRRHGEPGHHHRHGNGSNAAEPAMENIPLSCSPPAHPRLGNHSQVLAAGRPTGPSRST